MNILAVDTAGKTAGVALLQDDRLLYECYLDAGMTHSETILPLIDNCLKFCHLTCADITPYRSMSAQVMPQVFRQVSIIGISVSLWVMPASR